MTESPEQNQQEKNTVTNSVLGAGQNLHIGDIHYHHENQSGTVNDKPGIGIWQKRGIGVMLVVILFIVVKYADCNWMQIRPDESIYKNPETAQPSVSNIPPGAGKTNDTILLKQPIKPARTQPKNKDSDKEMSGMITDSDTGQPLPGVQVVAEGMDKAVVTGNTGRFQLFLDRVGPSRETRLYFYKQGYEPWEETFYQIPKTGIRSVLKKEEQE